MKAPLPMKSLHAAILSGSAALAIAGAFAGACASSPSSAAPRQKAAERLEALPSRYALLDGKKVHYKVTGSGKTAIVLVHGWTCDLTFFRDQLPLAVDHRLLLVDLPGHGKSEKPVAWSMNGFARAVEAAMDDAGIRSATVVGHSMGTPVARQLWRITPSRTAGIVALDGSLKNFFAKPGDEKAYLAALEGPQGREGFLKRVDGMLPPSMPAGERDFIRAKMTSTPQDVVLGAAQAMFDPDVWKDDPVGVPLLSILAKSPFWNDAYRGYVRMLNPKAEFLELDGVTHFLMLEKPEEVNASISRFAAGR